MKDNERSTVDIRKGDQRFLTRTAWLHSRHSFSFGPHYDPRNVGHGLLIVHNDDKVQPGSGFMTHPHQDMEIVTWVIEGELEHQDSEGNKGIIYPGLAQRMSAGTGIWHSEMNSQGDKPVHFIQMWIIPDTERIKPSYEQLDIGHELEKGQLLPVASGKERGDQAAISIHQKGATLWVGRLKHGQGATLPDAPYVHLFVAKGAVALEGATPCLQAGDAARLTAVGPRSITAETPTGAEVLIWESNSHVRRL